MAESQKQGLILAIDPGMRKLGFALVTLEGVPVRQGIISAARFEGEIAGLPEHVRVEQVVLGDGTNRMNIEAALRRLLPQASISLVDERASTVDAWQLKRQETSGGNPLRSLWFTLGQLFFAGPVDDYAARVLAIRHLSSRRAAQAAKQ